MRSFPSFATALLAAAAVIPTLSSCLDDYTGEELDDVPAGSGGRSAGGGSAGTTSTSKAGSGAGAASGGKGGSSGGESATAASGTTGGSPPSTGGGSSGGTGGGGGTGGSDATGGSSGSGGATGGAPNGGVPGNGGRGGGSAGAGRSGSSGAGSGNEGGSPPSSGSGCEARDFIFCEDFEATDIGDIPDGWTRQGNPVGVEDDEAHGGERSLKLGQADNTERRIARSATPLGSEHWGRVYYKVQTPVPDAFVHSTLVSLIGDGPTNGRSDYRPIDTVKQSKDLPDIGSRHNWIFNVQIIGESEFGRETEYDFEFDGQWHCAEYHIRAANQSYAFYLDGELELEFENGAGNYSRSDIPDEFESLRIGWLNYQSAEPGFVAWIDDIAFDDERIGCE